MLSCMRDSSEILTSLATLAYSFGNPGGGWLLLRNELLRGAATGLALLCKNLSGFAGTLGFSLGSGGFLIFTEGFGVPLRMAVEA